MIDENLFNQFQDILLGDSQDFTPINKTIERFPQESITRARSQAIRRLVLVLDALKRGRAGILDIVVLLRQLIRTYGNIHIPPALWEQIKTQAEQSSLIGIPQEDDVVDVIARDWQADWLPNSARIDAFEPRRRDESFTGDGMLISMNSIWTTYRSQAQKAAVDLWLFAAPGSTTLVTLPTGEGKSLCTLLPAWFDSLGGKRASGTTLVVVPTVALAHDQQKQAGAFFPNARGDFFKPTSRTGEDTLAERQDIQQAVLDGTLPVLFTSPESLLQSRLYDTCLTAAARGLISRLVIDETHLVETWGAGFRPEFQMLAPYRRTLLDCTDGALKTLLLSATVTDSSLETLMQLFGDEDDFVIVEANRLRTEIDYWFNFAGSKITRQHRIIEALRHLPRPLILYVTRPLHAREWRHRLEEEGYTRIADFSGDTPDRERSRLIHAWDADEIDIMVATSAFGLGVDKRHVRAVVHATLPENLNRFYQEVGRGGRDGCRSVSLICVTKDDIGMALSLQPKLITSEMGYQRWLGMIRTARPHPDYPNQVLVDLDATRPNAPAMERNDLNREWNIRLLLLMQRANLIEVVTAPLPAYKQGEDDISWLPIRVLEPAVRNNAEVFESCVESFRESEKYESNIDIERMQDIVRVFSGAENMEDYCLAEEIGSLYMHAQPVCSGCPACRASGEPVYPYESLAFNIEYPAGLCASVNAHFVELDQVLKDKMGSWRCLNATWGGARQVDSLVAYLDLFVDLCHAGFQQIIYPIELLENPEVRDRFVRALGAFNRPMHTHRLLPACWIVEKCYPLFPLNTLIIYPPDEKRAVDLYTTVRGTDFPALLNIVHEGIRVEQRRFTEVADGLNESVERLENLLHDTTSLPDLF